MWSQSFWGVVSSPLETNLLPPPRDQLSPAIKTFLRCWKPTSVQLWKQELFARKRPRWSPNTTKLGLIKLWINTQLFDVDVKLSAVERETERKRERWRRLNMKEINLQECCYSLFNALNPNFIIRPSCDKSGQSCHGISCVCYDDVSPCLLLSER